MIAVASGFPAFPGQPYGASLLPTVLGIGFLLSGGGLILRDIRKRVAGQGPHEPFFELGETLRRRDGILSGGLMIAAVLAHIFLAPTVGFIPVSLVSIFVLLVWFGISPLKALAISIAGTAMCWIFFAILLKVPLARGPFEGLL